MAGNYSFGIKPIRFEPINLTGKRKSKRKAFNISTKKIEWNKAAGRAEDDFKTTSKCRKPSCRRKLIWGSRTYDFDHFNNNPADNSQKNCRLFCKSCHGNLTVIGKRKKKSKLTGYTTGYTTIKKKVGYKKPKKTKKPKKRRKPKIKQLPPLVVFPKIPKGPFI